jgi:hypothetical protein
MMLTPGLAHMLNNSSGLHHKETAHLVCQIVHDQVQLVGHQARGLARAHHELVKLALAKRALLAVILQAAQAMQKP